MEEGNSLPKARAYRPKAVQSPSKVRIEWLIDTEQVGIDELTIWLSSFISFVPLFLLMMLQLF